MRFLGSKYAKNAFAAGAPSRTPLGSLQRSPDPLAEFGGPLHGREGRTGGGAETAYSR